MTKTIENVLVGVAELSVRQPNDALAEWSTVQAHLGTYSAKLYKGGSGNAGSTHLQITPPAGTTMTLWTAGIATNSFWHHCSAVTANFGQMEFRFEDPNSLAWAEITAVPLQGHPGGAVWAQTVLGAADLTYGYGGHTELDTPFFVWGLATAGNAIEAAIAALDAAACTPGDWLLTRVRIELWEADPLRTMYVDTVEIMGVTYTVEPGGTAPAMTLSSPFEEVGYTEDGVTLEYTADETDIEVEEETFPISRVITKETLAVTCNMAEASLANINNAMAGAVLSGNILSLGGGVNKTMNLRIKGDTPSGYIREIIIPKATATGAVGMPYKKGEKTVVPVTFQALKSDSPACTIVDNAA